MGIWVYGCTGVWVYGCVLVVITVSSLGSCRRTENCVDVEGNTPLHLAVTNDHSQCVKLLLLHGSSITFSE